MPVLPDRSDAIRADRENVLDASGGGVWQVCGKNRRVGCIAHFVMTSTAFGARAACPQQGEGIKAGVVVVPDDREFLILAIGGYGDRFHIYLFEYI
jgi:hypothetical protein